MPQCNLSQTGTHEYEPDRHILSQVTCLYCGHTKLCTKAKCLTKYLKYRRNMQQREGLLNVVVPLDGPSASLLADVLASCQIKMCVQSTVTLLEGFVPHALQAEPRMVEELRHVLHAHPAVTFRKLHKVRRSDRSTDLLLADVTLHPRVASSARAAANGPQCVLPQYPAHVALGTVPREGRVSVHALKSVRSVLQGKTLTVDPGRVVCAGVNDRIGRRHVGACHQGGTVVRGRRQMPPPQYKNQHYRAPSADLTAAETYLSDPDTVSSSDGDGSLSPSSSEGKCTVVTADDVNESDVLHIDLTFLDNFNDNVVQAPPVRSNNGHGYGCGYGCNTQPLPAAVNNVHFGSTFLPNTSDLNFGAA